MISDLFDLFAVVCIAIGSAIIGYRWRETYGKD